MFKGLFHLLQKRLLVGLYKSNNMKSAILVYIFTDILFISDTILERLT